jgi:phosphoserine phosphatase
MKTSLGDEIEAGSTSFRFKDLLFKGYELGIKVKFVPITIEITKAGQNTIKQRYITILGEHYC